MKRGSFAIITAKDGQVSVKGLLSENFYVHRTYRGPGHTVTHIPTGRSIVQAIPHARARKIVEALEHETFPVPWAEVTEENARQNSDKAVPIIRGTK
jgi:hypothetical protein